MGFLRQLHKIQRDAMGLIDSIKNASTSLKVGDVLKSNNARLKESDPENATLNLGGIPGKVVLVGVPGAFTPPCSSQVPGYVQHYEAFKAKGVKDIYIVAVNDAFVVQAWKEKLGASASPVHFLADDTGAFTASIGQALRRLGPSGQQALQTL